MGYSFITEKFKKRWIRAIFLHENGQIERKTCEYEINNTFTKDKCSYIVDQKLIKYEKHIPYLVYFHDNPIPISFIHSKHEFNGKVITSELFNDVLESKVIKEMVSSGAAENLILILLCVVVLLGILNLAVSSGAFTQTAANMTNMTNMTNLTVIH
jgi:hypothetical protein